VHPPKPHIPPPVPTRFPRKLIAVQGVVYCKSCNYSGVDTLLGAKPVLGNLFKLPNLSGLSLSLFFKNSVELI
jgi:hypothetical protein